MADNIVTRLRSHLVRRDTNPRTHWDGCIDSHPICALAWALDEIERLREREQDLRMLAEQDACEIERLRNDLTDVRASCGLLANHLDGKVHQTIVDSLWKVARRG